MKSILKRFLFRALSRQGKTICAQADLDRSLRFTRALAEAHHTAGGDVDCLVFSKDRALQLHAFLGSYADLCANRPKMTVLYRTSDEAHRRSYEELAASIPAGAVEFIGETDFRAQLTEHATRSRASKILLFVDDMLFKEPLDFDRLAAIDTAKHILSLTRGRDLVYSSVLEKNLTPPPLAAGPQGFLEFSWRADDFSDWTFPLGVSGYMYGMGEWRAMLEALEFRAPNSLEASMQALVPVYQDRPGLCTDKAVCVCVHANMVQTELSNPTLGNFSVEQLLAEWQAGRMIERRAFYGLDLNVAEVLSYTFADRSSQMAQSSM